MIRDTYKVLAHLRLGSGHCREQNLATGNAQFLIPVRPQPEQLSRDLGSVACRVAQSPCQLLAKEGNSREEDSGAIECGAGNGSWSAAASE